jgi:hypothetical protein
MTVFTLIEDLRNPVFTDTLFLANCSHCLKALSTLFPFSLKAICNSKETYCKAAFIFIDTIPGISIVSAQIWFDLLSTGLWPAISIPIIYVRNYLIHDVPHIQSFPRGY